MKPTPVEALLVRAARPADDAMRLHALCRGTMQTLPKCPVRGFEDFAVWYSPGVAAPALAIAADPDAAWLHTNRANTIAIVTDEMASAVAHTLADFAERRGLREDAILPRMDEWDLHPRLAVAAAMAAQAQGLARVARTADDIEAETRRVIGAAREATAVLMRAGVIPDVR